MSDLVDKTLGKYRLVEQLGRGGMAEVYKAHQPGLDRYVAIKVLRSHETYEVDFPKRFKREATAIAYLRHPNIVQVYDFDVEGDNLYYMVMEFIEGPTLRAEIEARQVNRQPFTLNEIANLFTGLTAAVDYAHSRSMAHRDLKPANVMFTAEGQVVLTDFGTAYLMGASASTTGGLIGTPLYMSPEQCRSEHGDARSDIYSLGVILYELATGRVPFDADTPFGIVLKHIHDPLPMPRAVNPALSPDVEAVIAKAMSKAPDERYQTAGALGQALREAVDMTAIASHSAARTVVLIAARTQPVVGDIPGTPRLCPYRGLSPFREQDSAFFFGRKYFVDRLVDAVWNKPLVAVLGPGGSGKTSVVSAGLVPRLRQGAALRQPGRTWGIASFRPGPRPFHALAAALRITFRLRPEEPDNQTAAEQLAAALSQGDISLEALEAQILRSNPGMERLLLIVDQLEELCTLCPEPEVSRRFLAVLLAAITPQPAGRDSRLVIALTLRSDFSGWALSQRLLADALQNTILFLDPMTREELTQAIESPAEAQETTFEVGLVERILEDTGVPAASLPLLGFTLASMWDRQSKAQLTHAAYQSVGGVAQALTLHVEGVFEKLNAEELAQAQRIFMRMVRFGEGTQDTARPVTQAELGDDDWAMVKRLAAAQLLTIAHDSLGQEMAGLAHDSLVQALERIRRWRDEEFIFHAWHRRLRLALDRWEASRHAESALLEGGPLGEAEDWLGQRPAELSEAERGFIEKSVEQRARKTAEHAGVQQRELQATLHVAQEAQKVSQARARWTLRGLYAATLFLVLGFLTMLALVISQQWSWNARLANLELQVNTARAASTLAVALQGTAEAESTQVLGLQATVVAGRDQAEQSQLSAIGGRTTAEAQAGAYATAVADALSQNDAVQQQARVARSRELAALAANSLLVDAERSVLLALQAVLTTYSVDQTVTEEAQQALLLAVHASQPMLSLASHIDAITAVTFSPDGALLATASRDGTARVWRVSSGQEVLTLSGHTFDLNDVAFSPDGTRLATVGSDSRVKLWDLASGQELLTLSGHTGRIFGVAFSPDGTRLATASSDGLGIVWELETGQAAFPLQGHTSRVLGIAFSPDGTRLITFAEGGIVKVWDAASGEELFTRSGRADAISDVAFSPDGLRFATGNADGSAQIWDAGSAQVLLTLTGHDRAVNGIAFSPDSAYLATAGGDSTVSMWDAASGRLLYTLSGFGRAINGIAFSPDGAYLAAADEDGTARLYALEAKDLIALARARVTRSFTADECQRYLHLPTCPAGPAP